MLFNAFYPPLSPATTKGVALHYPWTFRGLSISPPTFHLSSKSGFYIYSFNISYSPRSKIGESGRKRGNSRFSPDPWHQAQARFRDFLQKMPLSLYIQGCFIAIFTKSAASNSRPFSPIRVKIVSGFFPLFPERGRLKFRAKLLFGGGRVKSKTKKGILLWEQQTYISLPTFHIIRQYS